MDRGRLFLLVALAFPAAPTRAALAEGISALFPGTPGGSTSTVSGRADGLFAAPSEGLYPTLAAE